MKALCLTLFLLLNGLLLAQHSPISNVKIRVSNERDMVTINYDLERKSRIPFYDIFVRISLDGNQLPTPAGLTGDLGKQVTAGLGKKIVWDTRQDVTALSGALKIEVLTTTGIVRPGDCLPLKTAPVYAGIGGVAATGLGLLISGLSQRGNGGELYEVYQNNTDPTAAVYSELSRDEHYREANGKHKNGSWLAAGGGAILVAGGFVMLNRLWKVQAHNRKCGRAVSAITAPPVFRLSPVTAAGPGLAVIHRF